MNFLALSLLDCIILSDLTIVVLILQLGTGLLFSKMTVIK